MAFWERTKTNRLKRPSSIKKADPKWDSKYLPTNWCGQKNAVVGDYVHYDGSVSAGTVGKVIEIGANSLGYTAEVEMLSGKVEGCWLGALTVIDYAAVQEVKDFYINDGRPERIKVSW